jgi:DNA-binding response OmpR family regulator
MNRILFLSNDPVLKQKNIDVLARSGFDVCAASDALEGLLMVERDGFDAIIIDEGLSDISGYRASQKIRRYSEVPIILLGTESAEKVWAEVDDLGFDIYLKKPLYPRELMCYTKAILRRTQPQKLAQEIKSSDIQGTSVTPIQEAGPLQVQKTVKTRGLVKQETASGKQAELSMPAEVARAISISRETYKGAEVLAQNEPIRAMEADLERQVANLRAAIIRIGQLQKQIEEAKSIIRQQQQSLIAVENRLQETSDQLDNILGSSSAT